MREHRIWVTGYESLASLNEDKAGATSSSTANTSRLGRGTHRTAQERVPVRSDRAQMWGSR